MEKKTSQLLKTLFLFSLLLLAIPCYCLAGQGNISGYSFFDDNQNRIMDGTEDGIEGVKITISRLFLLRFLIEVGSTATDSDGRYNFSGVRNGIYFVKASAKENSEVGSQTLIKGTKIIFSNRDKNINFEFARKIFPVSVSISAAPQVVTKGEPSLLTWTSKNAVNLSIEGIGDVDPEGTCVVTPELTKKYIITAEGKNGSTVQDSVTVAVEIPALSAPRQSPTVAIAAAPLTILPGQASTLTWNSSNATDAEIDQGIGSVDLNGSIDVYPTETTTYTITVLGSEITENASITVNVERKLTYPSNGGHGNGGPYEYNPCEEETEDYDNSCDEEWDEDDNSTEKIRTAILLVSLYAEPGSSQATIIWKTGDENENFGFNIYRAESADGKYSKINSSVISSKAAAGLGTDYEFIDASAENNETYFYKLEDIDIYGRTTFHGPVITTPRFVYGLGN